MNDRNIITVPIPTGDSASIEFREHNGERVFRLRRSHFGAITHEWTNLDADGEVLGRVRQLEMPPRLEIHAPGWTVIPRDYRLRTESAREALRLFRQIERIEADRSASRGKGGAA